MTHAIAPVYFDALDRLLARPDPRDLPPRRHVCRYEGDPDRRSTRFPVILMAWLQQRHLGVDNEEPLGAVTRTALVQEPLVQNGRKRASMKPLRFPSPKSMPGVPAAARADIDDGSVLVAARAV